ncbi:MAG TPA: nucleoside-diphosphate sugar epimerase/dehydratase [Dongiaceae bacterium]|jgi:O-antigen biosynthesis protein WbqV
MTERPRFNRHFALAMIHDLVMAAISFPLALWLRVGYMPFDQPFAHTGFLLFVAVAAVVFFFSGLHRGIWRYASLPDLLTIARAVSLTVMLFLAILFLTTRLDGYPRSTLLINWFVLIFLLGAPRLGYRLLRDGNLSQLMQRLSPLAVPVLLVGSDDAADAFIREMRRAPSAPFAVLGILDTGGGGRLGRHIHGVPVLAGVDAAGGIVERLTAEGRAPQRFILTGDHLDRESLRRLVSVAETKGMTLARLPRLTDLHQAGGEAAAGTLLPVAVEDLLGRPRQVLDPAPMRELIAGRRVLVTGAGGSIGGELARQIAGFNPAHLVLFDHSEYLLYQIDREVAAIAPALPRRALLGDVRDRGRLDAVFAEEKPELVFHAAALKHVPLAETNPIEAMRTNVEGSRQVAEACLATGVAQMLLISTDKAVSPSSVMGAAKRAAELTCQALDRASDAAGKGCRFVAVRFGNVLGSTGSVVPLFQQQLASGGPITVTDREMTRYFMTTREAVELVLQAAALARRQPRPGGVLMLDMGEPVRIVDLARQMIRLAGKRPDIDIKIVFTGRRPGEKIHESLHRADEKATPAGVPGLMAVEAGAPDWASLAGVLDRLAAASAAGDLAAANAALSQLVPDYRREEAAA